MGQERDRSVFPKMAVGPIHFPYPGKVFFCRAEDRKCRVIADQLVERAMPNHDRFVAEPIIEFFAIHWAVPELVVAPAYEGDTRLNSRTGEVIFDLSLEGRFILLWCCRTRVRGIRQIPVIRSQERELGNHRGERGVHVRVYQPGHDYLVFEGSIDAAAASINPILQGVDTSDADNTSVSHCYRSCVGQPWLHGYYLACNVHGDWTGGLSGVDICCNEGDEEEGADQAEVLGDHPNSPYRVCCFQVARIIVAQGQALTSPDRLSYHYQP